jgi:DMSO/TMAO reductase YedYZ molybdopterin-dependent catalytic subunit
MASSNSEMKLGLGIVLIAIIVSAGTIIGLSLLPPPTPNQLVGETDIQIIKGETTVNLDFESLVDMTPTSGSSSSQNRFQNWRDAGTYVGVTLSSLVELVGGMDDNDVVRVNATDGWIQYYAYYNLYPNTSFTTLQGTLILAYSFNDTTPTTWGDGPRTVFVPADGAFSNDDANQTTHPAWFFGSAGARWVKNVASIEVIEDVYISGSFQVKIIEGTDEQDIYLVDLALMNNLEAFTAYQKSGGNWGGNGTYRGVLLSALVELITTIDDNDVVNVTASDGWTQSFAHYNLYPNASVETLQGDLILAYIYNGTMVPAWADGPRLAFLAPDGSYSNSDASQTTHPTWFSSASARWVKNVATIEIIRDSFPP